MKKKTFILLTCGALLLSGCSSTSLTNAVNNAINEATNQSSKAVETASPTNTPGPKETQLSLKGKGSVGDWKICVKKVSITQKIKNGSYHYYMANKGKAFVLFSLSVRNTGKESESFLPMVGYENKMVKATLYYKDEYEYSPTELLSYDKDFVGTIIQPLTTENGVLAFEVPKKIAKKKKNLKFKIGTKNESLIYSLQ